MYVYVCVSTFSNIFSSETTGPIKAKFHMASPWDGGTKVCSNSPGHMTKMAAVPIYGKNLKNLFSGTKGPMTLKLGMQHRVIEYYQIYLNDDPRLTITRFTAKSNLVPYAFVWEKGKQWIFPKTSVAEGGFNMSLVCFHILFPKYLRQFPTNVKKKYEQNKRRKRL